MADAQDETQEVEVEAEETTDSIWAKLGITDPDDEVSQEEEQAEVEAEKEDKMLKKISAKVDDLDKKFREEKLQQEKARFLDDASIDELEKDLFRGVEGMVRDPESLARAIELSKKLADKQRAKMEEYEAGAKAQVEKSWGVVNPGRMAQPTDDEAKKISDAIAAGDTVAGLHAIMGDDPMLEGRI